MDPGRLNMIMPATAEHVLRNILESVGIAVTPDTPGLGMLGLASRFGVMSPNLNRQWIMSLSVVEWVAHKKSKTVADVDFYQLDNKYFTSTWSMRFPSERRPRRVSRDNQ